MKHHLLFLLIILTALTLAVYSGIQNKLNNQTFAQNAQTEKSIKLGTFDIPTGTPWPTFAPQPTSPGVTVPAGGLITGGPVAPGDPYYCIDDEDPDGCDDDTAFWVPKGTGGVTGTCGTIIEQGHKIVNSLPQEIKLNPDQCGGTRSCLNPAISNCNYNTGTYSGNYISTYMPIDAYNLAGFKELSKTNPSHVLASELLTWWQSPEANNAGYVFIPYSPSVIEQHATGTKNLTGCVMFLNLGGGVHVGLVNKLELLNSNGDGIISILQSGVSFYLDRFEISSWAITNVPQHGTNLQSVAGFGCHI